MKRKHGFFLGFAVLLIATMFTVAGCDMNGGDDDDGGSVLDSNGNPDPLKLSGTAWHRTENGYTATLTFAGISAFKMTYSDGYTNTGTYSVSGKTITFKSGANTIMTATISGGTLRVEGGGDFTRIESEPPETAQSDYYGTWTWDSDPRLSFVITQTTYKRQGSDWSFTMPISSWTPVTNTNRDTSDIYPNGYVISGTVTAHTGPTAYEVGRSFSVTLFMRINNKQKIREIVDDATSHYVTIWSKQE
jgi:hypothetical protein